MVLYCILCGRKDKSVSYLRFPLNKHNRKQWLNFCKMSEENIRDSYRLCTNHFKPEDLRKRSKCVVVQAEAVGFNNNPSAKHFESSYKRLLVRHEVKAAETGNCMINDIQILFVSSANKKDTLFTEEENMQITSSADVLFDHDYLSTLWNRSPYVEVVTYISGFVVKKILKNGNICNTCAPFLTASSQDDMSKYTLIKMKTRGMLIYPSRDVIIIARTTERIIRANDHILFTQKNIKESLIIKTFQAVSINHIVFNDNIMTEHTKNQGIIDNHKTQLIKAIIKTYIVLRLFHEGKRATEIKRNNYIRQKYSKLILFKNQ